MYTETPCSAHAVARTAQLARKKRLAFPYGMHSHCQQADASAIRGDMVHHKEYPKKPIAQAALSCKLPFGEFVAWERLIRGEKLSKQDNDWIKSRMAEVGKGIAGHDCTG